MDFWARLLGGNYPPKKPPSKATANDPSARLARFRRVFDSILQLCNQPRNLDTEGPLLEKLHAHLERLVVLIREETRAPIPHVCIQYAATKQIYAVIARAATVSQYEPVIKATVAVFAALIDSEEEEFLSSGPFAKSLMRLIMRTVDNGNVLLGIDTETAVLEVLFTIAAKIRLEPVILPVWFQSKPKPQALDYETIKENSFAGVTQKDDFPLCYLLIDRVHHEGRIGDFARTGLLYIFEATGRSLELEDWVMSSDLPTLMASGLGALYSQLSRELSILHPDTTLPAVLAMSDYSTTHHRADAESAFSERHQSHITTFLSYLAFWQDVLDHCRSPEVNQTLLDHFQILFLQQLLYPSLLQSSDTDAGSSIAVLTYMTTILESLEYPNLIHMILIYLLNIEDDADLIPTTNTPSASLVLSKSSENIRRRESLLQMAAPNGDDMVEPTLFSLVDLILNSLGSRNDQTVYAGLKLTATLVAKQKKYAMGTLLKVRRERSSALARSMGGLKIEVGKYSSLLLEQHGFDEAYAALCDDLEPIIEAQIPLDGPAEGQTDEKEEPQPCQYRLPSEDPLLHALLGLMRYFFSNSIDVNLALTQAIMSIVSCIEIRLDGWVALDPSSYSFSSDTSNQANRWESFLDDEENTAWSALQAACKQPLWADDSSPTLYSVLQSLTQDLNRVRASVPNLDQLVAGRKAMLQGIGIEIPASVPPSHVGSPGQGPSLDVPRLSRMAILSSMSQGGDNKATNTQSPLSRSPSRPRPAEAASMPARPIFQPPPPETPSTTDVLMQQIKFGPAASVTGEDDKAEAGDEHSASLNHVLTNLVVLQEFIMELLAVLQVRAAVLGEKEVRSM